MFLTVTCERDQKQFTNEQIKASLQNVLRKGAHKLMFYKGVENYSCYLQKDK